jgi:hypothetical protein
LWHGDDYQPLADLLKDVETAATTAVMDGPARLGDDRHDADGDRGSTTPSARRR